MRMFCRSLFVLFLLLIAFCPSSIYGFWLYIWYIQTLLETILNWNIVYIRLIFLTIFFCLFKTRTLIFIVISCVFYVQFFWGERWLFFLFWYCRLCWQSLFKLSFHTDIQSTIIFVLLVYNDIQSTIIFVLSAYNDIQWAIILVLST